MPDRTAAVVEHLNRWKDGIERRLLILLGARQVGKTWTLKEWNLIPTATPFLAVSKGVVRLKAERPPIRRRLSRMVRSNKSKDNMATLAVDSVND